MIDLSKDVIVIGGGVAGLCAAIELCRQGISPLVIEAGNYPSQKVCGEFLSPESLNWLRELNIPFVPVKDAHFHIQERKTIYPFQRHAGGLSHSNLDPMLADSAVKLGATIYTNTKVEELKAKEHGKKHILHLSNGKVMHASSLIIATGRIPSLITPFVEAKYIGIKAHFEGVDLPHTLKMFGLPGAYLGLSPIEDGKVNLACLAKMNLVKKSKSISHMMEDLISNNSQLKGLLDPARQLFDWMAAPVPFLGFKKIPEWNDAYFIGDAALSIPPASGLGLSLAIASGTLAARFAANNDAISFKKAYRQLCLRPLMVAKGLHYLLMNPLIGNYAIRACNLFPSLSHQLFTASRLRS